VKCMEDTARSSRRTDLRRLPGRYDPWGSCDRKNSGPDARGSGAEFPVS